jgi:hypothetical protein
VYWFGPGDSCIGTCSTAGARSLFGVDDDVCVGSVDRAIWSAEAIASTRPRGFTPQCYKRSSSPPRRSLLCGWR